MKKIPTLFVRDSEDMSKVTEEVHPDCQWVLDGEGIATRKYDGTCVMLDEEGDWWARREVKKGKDHPPNFSLEEYDPNTGKSVGWEPMAQSPFAKFHNQVLERATGDILPGTYELCGPKINRGPDGFSEHVLVMHGADVIPDEAHRDYDSIRDLVIQLGEQGWEGIVWHHPDGRMAKLKARDF
jgi:hypothetical protein